MFILEGGEILVYLERPHKGSLSSEAIRPPPLILPDRATQVSRATILYGFIWQVNNVWAMLRQRTKGGRCM